ncbi:MAG: hypothetical protein M3Q58_12795 [Bacteroidota bacterium]|nr:hypothetical protein [Bacteroidota bacterium]
MKLVTKGLSSLHACFFSTNNKIVRAENGTFWQNYYIKEQCNLAQFLVLIKKNYLPVELQKNGKLILHIQENILPTLVFSRVW